MRLTLTRKIAGFTTLLLVVVVVILSCASARTVRRSGEQRIEEYRSTLTAERKQTLDRILKTGVYVDDVDTLVARERQKVEQDVAAVVRQNVATALLALVGLLTVAAFALHRFVSRPLAVISSGIRDLGNDLTVRLPILTNDELGDLARWINHHVKDLGELIGSVAEVTTSITSHTTTLSTTVEAQAGFSAELSSSVVEISSTMDEFSSAARQIASHSQGVAEVAEKTLLATIDGAAEVENLTNKMNEIREDNETNLREVVELGRKSKEITKIMEIINGVANQTKLIAFNAALEAASAGEAGKRFGVVAVEIRRLADSVVESISEIEGKTTEIMDAVNRLVICSEKSSNGVHAGLACSSQTSTVLTEVVRNAETAADSAKQISLSTQQQQTASGQVVVALREIEKGTRHSAEAIHQTSAVSRDLARLSSDLEQLLAKSRLFGTAAKEPEG